MNKITESELEIMKVLWNEGEATSLKIIEEVSKETNWNKNTIKTLLSRLVEKEAINVLKNKGSLYLYTPLISEQEYKKSESEHFINKLYNGSVNEMLISFAKSKALTKNDLEDLMKLIDEEVE